MSEENHIEDNSILEKLKFQWRQEVPQYGDKLLHRLDEFRKKNMFYDVTLKATDADLAAHKVVLAASGGGMFKSHFIDPKTKQILGSVNEVNFACPAAGLRPILKFAYSGVLEITEENLFPSYLAAAVTEMKEVQEICANLAMSRLAWIIDFDGSEATVPRLNAENKMTNEKGDNELSLEEAFALLHRLLVLNVASFSSESEVLQQNAILNGENEECCEFLCLEEIEKRWPKFTSTYKAIVKCLRKIKLSKTHENERESAKTNNTASSNSQNVPQATLVADDVTSGSSKVEEPSKAESKAIKSDESSTNVPKPTESKTEENSQKTESSVAVTENKSSVATVNTATTETKPATKPRTVSVTQDTPKVIGNGSAKVPPTAHKRQRSLGATTPAMPTKTPPKPTTPIPRTSSGPRKKHAAPKPPGPPPGTVIKNATPKASPHGSPRKTKPTPKPANGAPASAQKPIPPRPKPPSIKKNNPDRNSGARYDDALNPFADEEEDSVNQERSDNYDSSLNPFG